MQIIIVIQFLKLKKNLIISNSLTSGSNISFQVGSGLDSSFINIPEGKDMVISTPDNLTSQSTLYLKSNKTINEYFE